MSDVIGVSGTIDIAIYPDVLPSSLTEYEQLQLVRHMEPLRSYRTENVTCVGMHEYFVDNLDPEQTTSLDALALAVGDDDSTEPTTTNTSLNNEVDRFGYTESVDEGTELRISTLISEGSLNNQPVREVGLVSDATSGGTLFNHSIIPELVKDNTETMTIDVTLSFEAV